MSELTKQQSPLDTKYVYVCPSSGKGSKVELHARKHDALAEYEDSKPTAETIRLMFRAEITRSDGVRVHHVDYAPPGGGKDSIQYDFRWLHALQGMEDHCVKHDMTFRVGYANPPKDGPLNDERTKADQKKWLHRFSHAIWHENELEIEMKKKEAEAKHKTVEDKKVDDDTLAEIANIAISNTDAPVSTVVTGIVAAVVSAVVSADADDIKQPTTAQKAKEDTIAKTSDPLNEEMKPSQVKTETSTTSTDITKQGAETQEPSKADTTEKTVEENNDMEWEMVEKEVEASEVIDTQNQGKQCTMM